MNPDKYAVIGNPVAHSLSPIIHAAFAKQCGQDISYTKILAPVDDFGAVVADFQAQGGKGLNITLPFKEQAFRLSKECTERARIAGAVNTLAFAQADAVWGDITDGVGLVRDICSNHGQSVHGKHLALLGAGGAVRGVLADLLAERPASVLIVNRNRERAEAIVAACNSPLVAAGHYPDMAGRRFDIVINGTAASLQDSLPPVPDGVLAPAAYCYDMVYAKAATAFLRWAAAQGAGAWNDGLGMLVEQAAEAFYLWRGIRPATAPVIQQLRHPDA